MVQTETFTLVTSDGVELGADTAVPDHPVAAAVLAHPHPSYGGDRFNIVVDALHRGLPARSIATLRFDFRAGADPATTALLDARAALDHLAAAVPGVALVACGYSFGALTVAGLHEDPRLQGWVLVAPPFQPEAAAALGRDRRPKLLLVPEHDQFCPPARAEEITRGWAATRVVAIPSVDHFLAGGTTFVTEQAADAIRALTPA